MCQIANETACWHTLNDCFSCRFIKVGYWLVIARPLQPNNSFPKPWRWHDERCCYPDSNQLWEDSHYDYQMWHLLVKTSQLLRYISNIMIDSDVKSCLLFWHHIPGHEIMFARQACGCPWPKSQTLIRKVLLVLVTSTAIHVMVYISKLNSMLEHQTLLWRNPVHTPCHTVHQLLCHNALDLQQKQANLRHHTLLGRDQTFCCCDTSWHAESGGQHE